MFATLKNGPKSVKIREIMKLYSVVSSFLFIVSHRSMHSYDSQDHSLWYLWETTKTRGWYVKGRSYERKEGLQVVWILLHSVFDHSIHSSSGSYFFWKVDMIINSEFHIGANYKDVIRSSGQHGHPTNSSIVNEMYSGIDDQYFSSATDIIDIHSADIEVWSHIHS